MKLIIQIPCYNEEENISKVIDGLPKKIKGIDKIEYMVINDGSTDRTRKIAIEKKINYLIDIFPNKGLANAFMTGIDNCLEKGADIIVNIDGDNQYLGTDIEKLIQPILKKQCDMVIGNRQIEKFSPIKRFLQRLGSKIISILSGKRIPDAPSGFRAFTRDYALKLNVYNIFSYTLETIIQASNNRIKLETVDITSNPNTRKSRLFKNIPQYIFKSSANVTKALFIYYSSKIWLIMFTLFLLITIMSFMLLGEKTYLPYILIIITVQLFISLMQSISLQANRIQLEKIQYYIKKNKYDNNT